MIDTTTEGQPYEQVAAYFRTEILEGRLAVDAALPPIRDIAEGAGVSPGTVQRAIRELASEGFVRTKPRSGNVVARTSAPILLGGSRSNRVKRGGVLHRAGETVDGLTRTMAECPDDIANLFGIAPGEDIIRGTRRYADASGPTSFVESWVPERYAEIVPELLRSDAPMEHGWHGLLAARTSERIKERQERIRAHCATPQELAPLGLQAEGAAPVLFRYVHFWNDRGELADVGVDLYAPGREVLMERRPV